MNNIGVIFNRYSKLPKYSVSFETSDGDAKSLVLQLLAKCDLLTRDQSRQEDNLLELIDQAEEKFNQEINEIVGEKGFYSDWFWFTQDFPKVRARIRQAFLKKTEMNQLLKECEDTLANKGKYQKMLKSWLVDIETKWSEIELKDLEKEIDRLASDMIRSATPRFNSTLNTFTKLALSQNVQENDIRQELLDTEELDYTQESDKKFRDLSEEQCRFVNRARFEYSSDLVALQCLVSYRYFFYNLRTRVRISEPEIWKSLLVNYNAN